MPIWRQEWEDYFPLRSGDAPVADPVNDFNRIYLDGSNSLRMVEPDGTDVALGGGGGGSPSAATIRMSTSPDLSSTQLMPFDTVLVDTDDYFDTISGKFTIPAGKAGLFLVGAEAGIGDASTSLGATQCELSINNSGDDRGTNQEIGFSLNATNCGLMQLDDGDQLNARLLFDGDGTVTAFGNQCKFWLVKIT